MKKALCIIIFLIVVAAIFFIPVGESETVVSSFGSWKIEILGIDSDGNEVPFTAKTNTLQAMRFTYNGKNVDTVKYRLYAKATGSGYTSCELDLSDVESDGIVYKESGGPGSYSHIWSETSGASSINIPLNTDYEQVFERSYLLSALDDVPSDSYKMQIRFRGDAQYRGIGSATGDWASETIQLDSTINLENNDNDDGDDNPDDPVIPGPPDDMTEYNIIVVTNPKAERVTCDYGDSYDFYYGYPQIETSTANPAVFQRINGKYTIHSYWSDGYDESEPVTISGDHKRILMNIGNKFQMVDTLFTFESFNTINTYQTSDNYYLGGI